MGKPEDFVYLVVWEFAPHWLDEFYRLCDKKAVKGTRVDDLFIEWNIKNKHDGYYDDLAYIDRGTIRDALAIPRNTFDEILSELGLRYHWDGPIFCGDEAKPITRIAKKYILTPKEKQSFFMYFGDNSTDNLYSLFIGGDFAPIARGYALALSVDNLADLCMTGTYLKGNRWEFYTNETLLNAVKDLAFSDRKTGILGNIRDRIKNNGSPTLGGDSATDTPKETARAGGDDVRRQYQQTERIGCGNPDKTDRNNFNEMIRNFAETVGIPKDKHETKHFDRGKTGYKNYSDVANKSPLICYESKDGEEYKCGKDKNGKYWIKKDSRTSPIWILKTPLN